MNQCDTLNVFVENRPGNTEFQEKGAFLINSYHFVFIFNLVNF